MEMVLIFTFCLILAGTDAVTTVTGYRGRSVQIKCSYTSGYENNEKYLCRGKCPYVGYNDIPVKSGSPAKDSRFSLYDDTTAKVFTVTITDLRPEDKGTYWCVIERKGKNIYTEILLQVNTGARTEKSLDECCSRSLRDGGMRRAVLEDRRERGAVRGVISAERCSCPLYCVTHHTHDTFHFNTLHEYISACWEQTSNNRNSNRHHSCVCGSGAASLFPFICFRSTEEKEDPRVISSSTCTKLLKPASGSMS
ncbi:uncharacterized protein Hap1MRO34_020073 [Clarias gariepinus]